MSIFKVMAGTHLVDDEHTTLEYAEKAVIRIRDKYPEGESIVIHWFDTQMGRSGHYLVGSFFFEPGSSQATRFVRF